MAKKPTINDYKDRMSAPIGAVQIDVKTGKPIRTGKKTTKKKRK